MKKTSPVFFKILLFFFKYLASLYFDYCKLCDFLLLDDRFELTTIILNTDRILIGYIIM